ncbi:MAG: hypothetical protein U0794_12890 [Isosphaeraceae bacterium]
MADSISAHVKDDGGSVARRKEVGLGSVKEALLLVVLAASGSFAAADGPSPEATKPAPPNAAGSEANSAPASEVSPNPSRPEPPAPPRKYLEAGANLFNKGRFDLAKKYLMAAHLYRDRLTASERVVLDVYREKLDHLLKGQAPSAASAPPPSEAPVPPQPAPSEPAPSTTVSSVGESAAAPTRVSSDTSVKPTSLSTSSASRSSRPTLDPIQALSRRPDESDTPNMTMPPAFQPGTGSEPGPLAPEVADPTAARIEAEAGVPSGSVSFRGTMDTKQKARWLLQLAREQILKQHFDVAEQAIAEARSLDVKWTMFDETPDRLAEALMKARQKAGLTEAPSSPGLLASVFPGQSPKDRRAARARLREARIALGANHLDRADEIVQEVRSWGVSYGLFDDTPDKVAAAIYDARRKSALRSAEVMIQSYYRDQMRKTTESGTMTGPPVHETLPD